MAKGKAISSDRSFDLVRSDEKALDITVFVLTESMQKSGGVRPPSENTAVPPVSKEIHVELRKTLQKSKSEFAGLRVYVELYAPSQPIVSAGDATLAARVA